MKVHAESKHGKTLEECFSGAEAQAQAIAEKLTAGKGGKGGKAGDSMTKAERKKKNAAMADDLLSAGLSTGKKGKKR